MLTLTCCQDHILTENVWFYGLKHHIVEISGDVTDAGQTTSKDRATQLLICELLSFAIQICRKKTIGNVAFCFFVHLQVFMLLEDCE